MLLRAFVCFPVAGPNPATRSSSPFELTFLFRVWDFPAAPIFLGTVCVYEWGRTGIEFLVFAFLFLFGASPISLKLRRM